MPKGEALKPYNFKKGQSGNPNGRPKGCLSLRTKLKIALDKIHKGTGTKYDELLIQSMLKDAIKEDGQSRRMIWQYVEGMPKEVKDLNLRLPQPITEILKDDLLQDNSNQEDNGSKEED